MSSSAGISTSDWIKGIGLSLLASIIGGASKLAIRKSWLIEHEQQEQRSSSSSSEPHRRMAMATDSTHSVESSPSSVEPTIVLPPQDESECSGDFLLMEPQTARMRKNETAAGRKTTVVIDDDVAVSGESLPTETVGTKHRRISRYHQQQQQQQSSSTTMTISCHHEVQQDETNEVTSSDEDDHENDRLCQSGDEIIVSSSRTRTATIRRRPQRHRSGSVKQRHCFAWCLRGFGMVGMTVFNPLCSVLAMNYASPSILAPFSGLTLVWIILFSYPVIGERPSPMQVVAASLIVLGEIVVAVFGDHTNDDGVSVNAVQRSYKYPPFVLYFVGLFIWMSLLIGWMKHAPSKSTLHRFAWGVSGGSVTGLQNFLKDALTILKATSSASHKSLPLLFFLLFALAGASAFGGLLLLTACMKRYDATYSSAMFVGSFVVSASIMSAVHYRTFQHLHGVSDYILYPVGLLTLMGGVYLLVMESGKRSSSPSILGDAAVVVRGEEDDDGADDDDEEEETISHEALHHIVHPSSPSRAPLVSSTEGALS